MLRTEKREIYLKYRNYKTKNGKKLSFHLEINIWKNIFQKKITNFSAGETSTFNPCEDGKVHTYSTSLKLESKTFLWNNENIKQSTHIKVTFTLKIKIQNHQFSQVCRLLLSYRSSHFQFLLEWESTYVCHDLNTDNQTIYVK